MRVILAFIILITIRVSAQTPAASDIGKIASAEAFHVQNVFKAAEYAAAPSNNFDVKYYRCEWTVDPAIRYIRGKVTVYYVTRATANSISFDLTDSLTADSVMQRDVALETAHTGNILTISFPVAVAGGIMDSVSIYYRGVPPATGFGSFVQSTHANIPVMWTLSEPFGSRDWWPCKNGLDDKADSIDVFVIHPSQYKAVSNGLLQGEVMSGADAITHWKHRYAIATYLICFAVTNYTMFTDTVTLGNVALPMQTFCYPESLDLFRTNTMPVLDAMRMYSNIFGEYPFIKEKYGHVQFGWSGGQEHQTSTFIVRPDEGLMAHELAHQWFGDKITCASWQDIWLNEGFATHLASMYMEQKYPAGIPAARKNEIDNITSLPGGSVKIDDTTSVGRIFDSRLTYLKGSHILYMLRWLLGDDIFLKGVRQYLSDPGMSYGFARTADLKRNLEEVSKKDLTPFFNDWFEGQGYPSYTVEWSPAGNDYARIKISQTTSHPSVPFFEMPVALLFKNGTQQKTVIIDSRSSGELFYRKIGFAADTVIIDPDYWLISKNNVSKKLVPADPQNTIQVFPNPAHDHISVYLQNFSYPGVTLAFYNAGGQLLYSRGIVLYNNSYFEEINIAAYAAGVYFLKISSGNKTIFVKKIIK